MRATLLIFGTFVILGVDPNRIYATDVESRSESVSEPHPLNPGTIDISPGITAFPNSGDPSSYQIKQAIIPVQLFFLDKVSLGAVSMYFAPGFSSAAQDPSKPLLLVGPDADVTFFQSGNFRADVGAAILFEPGGPQSFISPNVGIGYFVSNNVSIGLVYDALLDLKSSLLSIRTAGTPEDGHAVLLQISAFH
jgi:hypothetical protein